MIEAEAEVVIGAGEGEEDGNNRLFRIIRIDPFLQPPILKALFEQIPGEDLAKCRLVNKLWYEESLSTWRSNATLKFGKEGLVSTRDDGSRRTTSLGEFLDLWDEGDWGSCPFQQFSLDHWDFTPQNVEQQRFIKLVGCHITSLTLKWCSFVGRDNFRRIIYQAFPNLQFLKMDKCTVDKLSYNWDEPTEEIRVYEEPAFGVHELKSLDLPSCPPDSMMAMLSHFHKLKSLHVEIFAQGRECYRDLLETIRVIRAQDQTKLPLKNLDVDQFDFHIDSLWTASSIGIVKLHEQLNLPLQRFKLDLEPEEDIDWNFNDVIRDILQNHSSTLKNLSFCGDGAHGLCKSFPYGISLDNLEGLSIRTPCLVDNLNFLRYTPNLRTLYIERVSLSMSESDNLFYNSSQLEIGDWTLPSLRELSLELPLRHLCLCNLRKVMKWMPNVEHLYGFEMDDVKFSMVCNGWKKLKILEDRGEELTDEGVIGIRSAQGADGDEETQSSPNITKLKNLTIFWTGSSKLTAASVRDGFLKLANLELLSLGRSTKLDDEAKAALKRRKIKECQERD